MLLALRVHGLMHSCSQARPDHFSVARKNLSTIPELQSVVTMRQRAVSEGFDEKDVDAVVLDTRESSRILPSAHAALKPGGMLACVVPTTNQVCTPL